MKMDSRFYMEAPTNKKAKVTKTVEAHIQMSDDELIRTALNLPAEEKPA